MILGYTYLLNRPLIMIKKIFRYLNRMMAVFGFVIFFVIAIGAWKLTSILDVVKNMEPLTDQTILVLEVGGVPMNEINLENSLFDRLRGYSSQSLLEILDALNNAAKDDRIKGVFLSLEGDELSLSNAYELHHALLKLKEAGKVIYSFGYSFSESRNGIINYFLASVGDKIFMQPAAMFNLNGLALQSYFLKGFMEDFQISIQADGREEYKGVLEPYTRTDFSEPVKSNLKKLLESILASTYDDIAKAMKREKSEVEAIVDSSPHVDHYSVEKGFISELAYKDVVKNKFKEYIAEKSGLIKDNHDVNNEDNSKESPLKLTKSDEVKLVSIKTYTNQLPEQDKNEKIAIVVIDGDIVAPGKDMESVYNPFSPENIEKSFQDILKDKDIKAVVFRINSPGGAASGAESIWHAVKRTVDAKIPVVVSMSGVTASAGYYISAPATKIYALPVTITGSIGVAFMKPNFRKATEKYGISWDSIEAGVGGRTWSIVDDFSPEVWERIQKSTDHTYSIFMSKVVEGRKLDKDYVHSIAKGQVWSGIDAKENKLVDELGGFLEAIESAKELGNIKTDQPYLVLYNRRAVTLMGLLSSLEVEAAESLKAVMKNKFMKTGMMSRLNVSE